VSQFHPIWCLVTQESKLRKIFLGGPDIFGICSDISGPRPDMSVSQFSV
jgi:hypothetical protein